MPDVEAVSSSPTRGVPAISGAPVAGVFGSGPWSTGPATVALGVLVNCRRFSPLVQIAPEIPHSRPAGNVIVTSASESGVTVILNRSRRPSTRVPPVTRPPVTVNASSRSALKLMPMSSLNATRKVNALSPSCSDGTPSNDAVSGVASGSLLRIVPVASRSPSLSRAPSGFDSLSLNVSPSSSWASSVIGTDTGKRQPNCRAGHEHV